MGHSFSGPGGFTIRHKDCSVCVPLTKYQPFPGEKRKDVGELITAFKALPLSKNAPPDCYWWINCQFVPNDDSTLMVTSTAYQLRNGLSNVQVRNIPAGRICQFDLKPERIKCELINRTNSGTCPKLQVHPDSYFTCYLDINDVKIFNRTSNSMISIKAFEPHFRQYRSFALSPDGKKTCILARQGKIDYDLIIFGITVYTCPDITIHCSKISKDFRGTPVRSEMVDCKWSPDSHYVTVSISTGYVMTIHAKSGDVVSNIFPELLDDCSLSSVSAFDFDPRSCWQIMTVGASDGCLYIINIEDGDIICGSNCSRQDSIDAIQYTHDGNQIGMALHSFSIHLYDSNTCVLLYKLNMIDSCPELGSLPSPGNNPFIMKIDFTRSGEQLSTCCSDGYIRLWQLPININLKFICKLKILSLISQRDIKSLPLPMSLKDYLLPLPL